jgi:hypothetical protein
MLLSTVVLLNCKNVVFIINYIRVQNVDVGTSTKSNLYMYIYPRRCVILWMRPDEVLNVIVFYE